MHQTIQNWFDKNYIDEPTKNRLQQTIQPGDGSKNILITFATIGTISCGVLAFGTLVMDERWIELLRRKLGASEWVISITFSIITALLVWMSKRRLAKQQHISAINEAFNIMTVMSTAIALAYVGRIFYTEDGNYAILLMIATVVYLLIAIYLRSVVLWFATFLSLVGWWAAQTYFWSKGDVYFLGMNYPLRFAVFAVVILLVFAAIRKTTLLKHNLQPIRILLWFNLLVTFWALSIFGNSATIADWTDTRQNHFWYWALAYSVFTIGVAAYGLKKKDNLLRDLGLIFLLVNIYTRYFEYFWDKTNKGLFFAILAVSFWWMAKLLERWRKPITKTEL